MVHIVMFAALLNKTSVKLYVTCVFVCVSGYWEGVTCICSRGWWPFWNTSEVIKK